MQAARFPFNSPYQITQGYADNLNNYPEGHHGALDIVPTDNSGVVFPAPIYPLYAGSEISIQNTDPIHGKGIKEQVLLDQEFMDYLKSVNCLPANFSGQAYLDILYWHILEVLDGDGTAELDNPIAKAGNTGWVFHNGAPVPDNQKGQPPYPGLHLHLETSIGSNGQYFNLDKDPRGRIDPQLIFNYKKGQTVMLKLTKDLNSNTVYIEGEKGKIGLAGPACLDLVAKLTDDKPASSDPATPQVGILEQGFNIHN